MDFLERLFSFSPDGGNGSAEVTVMVVLMLAIQLLVKFRPRVLQILEQSSPGETSQPQARSSATRH